MRKHATSSVCKIVNNHSASELASTVKKLVLNDATILCDEWKAYDEFTNAGCKNTTEQLIAKMFSPTEEVT